ncbi:MAG TPA: class I tRNA ligase family protein, partial [Pirellulaceae bacterium]
VSERFELARNFTNKLWNAARFSLLGLEGYRPGSLPMSELTTEDRWMLSRLATVTRPVTEALESYRFADAARALYDFSWDEFCSFYVEMLKERLRDEAARPAAQRMLAHALDHLLRLLHPMIPFITEEIWSLLGKVAPQRGVPEPQKAEPILMRASWPVSAATEIDPVMEARFARFQATLGAIREIRSRQSIPPRQMLSFVVRCDDKIASLLRPLEPYFAAMAKANATAWGPHVTPPATSAQIKLPELEVFVDLAGLIDVDAELARNQKQRDKLLILIAGKEKKLGGGTFVDKAPPEVVAKERASLEDLRLQLESVESALTSLRQ